MLFVGFVVAVIGYVTIQICDEIKHGCMRWFHYVGGGFLLGGLVTIVIAVSVLTWRYLP